MKKSGQLSFQCPACPHSEQTGAGQDADDELEFDAAALELELERAAVFLGSNPYL